MKTILCKVHCFLQEIGYARAASTLAQQGYIAEAKRLMTMKRECTCC